MSVSITDVARSVRRAIESHNASEEKAVPASDVTVLLGTGGALDSLGLVRLIMTIERQVEDDFGVAISLTDEKAMSQQNSPFRSVGMLISYITACLDESR